MHEEKYFYLINISRLNLNDHTVLPSPNISTSPVNGTSPVLINDSPLKPIDDKSSSFNIANDSNSSNTINSHATLEQKPGLTQVYSDDSINVSPMKIYIDVKDLFLVHLFILRMIKKMNRFGSDNYERNMIKCWKNGTKR